MDANINQNGALIGRIRPHKVLSGKVVLPTFVGGDIYEGEYTITPKAGRSQTLETKNKMMSNNLTVLEIPFFETSNENGTTIFIANEV